MVIVQVIGGVMSRTYYINPNVNNTLYTPWFENPSFGAKNFHTLLTKCKTLADGDTILIVPGADVDDTEHVLYINYNFYIGVYNAQYITPKFTETNIYQNRPIVKLKCLSGSQGLNLNSSGIVIEGVAFSSGDYSLRVSMVAINVSGVTIRGCTFTMNNSIGNSSAITVLGVGGTTIDHCLFDINNASIDKMFGIFLNGVNSTVISNNYIRMNSPNCIGIQLSDKSNHNIIKNNIIGDVSIIDNETFISYGYDNIAINIATNGTYNNIKSNVIIVSGVNSKGIVYFIFNSSNSFISIDSVVSNNYILIRENDFQTIGIYFPPHAGYNIGGALAITNNIIEYRGSGNNDSIAIHASIRDFGIIDYNNIFGFSNPNIFVSNGDIDNITKLGDKNIFIDPSPVFIIDKDKYTDIRKFYCSNISECVGSGISVGVDYTNISGSITQDIELSSIGIGNDLITLDTHNINIVDSVCIDFKTTPLTDTTPTFTFFNSVFGDSAYRFNEIYRRSSFAPYKSTVYNNQFDYTLDASVSYPFSIHGNNGSVDHLYNTPLSYVCEHKMDLVPFTKITCPPNPGYGAHSYKNYPTGLWGFRRKLYENECGDRSCIIRNTIDSTHIITSIPPYDDNSVTIMVDSVSPPCLSAIGN